MVRGKKDAGDLGPAIEEAKAVLAGLQAEQRKKDTEATIAGTRQYRGAESLSALIREYMGLRQMTQTELAKRVGRTQGAISKLCRGHDDEDPIVPYLGERGPRDGRGELEPVLDLVQQELRIPRTLLEDVLEDERLAWAVEQSRRKTQAARERRERKRTTASGETPTKPKKRFHPKRGRQNRRSTQSRPEQPLHRRQLADDVSDRQRALVSAL